MQGKSCLLCLQALSGIAALMRHNMTIKGLQSLHSNAATLLQGVTWASRKTRESSEPGNGSLAAAMQCLAATAIVPQALTISTDWLSPTSVQQQLKSGSLPAEVGDHPRPLQLYARQSHLLWTSLSFY